LERKLNDASGFAVSVASARAIMVQLSGDSEGTLLLLIKMHILFMFRRDCCCMFQMPRILRLAKRLMKQIPKPEQVSMHKSTQE
jgi:hypothetical protein